MITTRFTNNHKYENGYRLVVDHSKRNITTAWLEERGCEFKVFSSEWGVYYYFSFIPKEVVVSISKKHPCQPIKPVVDVGVPIKQEKFVPIDLEVTYVPEIEIEANSTSIDVEFVEIIPFGTKLIEPAW